MEFLAVLLEPYKDLIATSATTAANFQQLSGAVICNDIRKQKSTTGFSVLPFMFGVVLSALFTIFGIILNDTPMVKASLIGTVLNIGYVWFFFWYTYDENDRKAAWTQVGYGGAFVAAVYAYTCIEDPKNLPFRYGLFTSAVIFYVVGSPLLGLREIIRKKSTEGLPFPIILSGTVVSFFWFLYGIVTRENFLIFQNGLIVLMSAVQLSMFAIYPSKPTKSKKSSSPSKSVNSSNKKKN